MMGLTAEMLARLYRISREMQDQFAARSRSCLGRNPVRRIQSGDYPHRRPRADGVLKSFNYDEVIRPENHRRDAVHA
ncbi:hypothetical protein MJ575_01775 [Klebsiella pneumoniae]|nr:hypothetical protein MJ575_01775 [Klebsiella pneumoniae]